VSDDTPVLLVDDPAPHVRRLTLNRPEKRNALNGDLRAAILNQLRANDDDPEVRVSVVRGAGVCFSAGYDLSPAPSPNEVDAAAPPGTFQRSVTEGWMSIWHLAKPVIAQVHGWCLAGGSELATGCDLVYVAEDARIGYPAVRFGTPDMQYQAWLLGMRRAMEFMLTGDALTGTEAATLGFATRAVPADALEATVLEVAAKIASIPADVVQINKRTVHRAMEHMGFPASIRSGTELSALAQHTSGFQAFLDERDRLGLTGALQQRDAPFGDYRTTAKDPAPDPA
jgi:enoyl-CoA hydratase